MGFTKSEIINLNNDISFLLYQLINLIKILVFKFFLNNNIFKIILVYYLNILKN